MVVICAPALQRLGQQGRHLENFRTKKVLKGDLRSLLIALYVTGPVTQGLVFCQLSWGRDISRDVHTYVQL